MWAIRRNPVPAAMRSSKHVRVHTEDLEEELQKREPPGFGSQGSPILSPTSLSEWKEQFQNAAKDQSRQERATQDQKRRQEHPH
jgi:hypothetical protein